MSFSRHLSLVVFLLTVFVAHSSAGSLPEVIRFGEVGSTNVKSIGGRPTGTGLVALASHLGYFEEEFGAGGPKIEQVYFAGTGPAQNEALAQGAIDFGTYGGVPNVIGLSSGIPARIVMTRRTSLTGGNYYIAVSPDAPLRTLADLKGKRVAVQLGTNPYQSLVYLLEDNGLSVKDVRIVNLQGNEALVAFKAGGVDAVFGTTNLLVLRDKGDVRILADTRAASRGHNLGSLIVSDKFSKSHPSTVARVIKVLVKASWWATEPANRDALLTFISERSFAFEHIKHDFEGSLVERYNPLIDHWFYAAFADTARFAHAHKLIRKPVADAALRAWFEPRYVEAALKDLKLDTYWPRETAATLRVRNPVSAP
jgi:sulfonate transport system substrate-binding protein